MNACNHRESESRNRNLSAAVLYVKPSRRNSNLYNSRENHHKVEILNYSVSLQYCKRNRDFITINFQKFSFFQGVFHVLERFIGLEPWDLLPLTIKCYRNFLQNYKGTIFGVAWTEKYRFEIIDAVTDESKSTIFDNLYRPTLLDRTISFFFLVRPLTSSLVNHWEIVFYLFSLSLEKISRRRVWKITVIKSLFFYDYDLIKSFISNFVLSFSLSIFFRRWGRLVKWSYKV